VIETRSRYALLPIPLLREPHPHRRLPQLRRGGHLRLQHVLLPHRVHAGRLGILRPEDRPGLPPVHHRPSLFLGAGAVAQLVPKIGARPILIAGSAASTGGLYLAVPDQRARQPTPARCSARPSSSAPAGRPAVRHAVPWSRSTNRVAEADSGVASSLLNTPASNSAAAIGLALLGNRGLGPSSAHSAHAQAAAAARAGHPGPPRAARWPRRSTATAPRQPGFAPRVPGRRPGIRAAHP